MPTTLKPKQQDT